MLLASALLLFLHHSPVAALCECGYSARIPGTAAPALFTDLIEANFAADPGSVHDNTDWAAQQFDKPPDPAAGFLGRAFRADSVVSQHGEMQIVVDARETESDAVVRSGEVATARADIMHGSFRVGMRVTPEAGTCAAFFWYLNDTQEIDMEFLSREYDHARSKFPVNLVLHSQQSLAHASDASATPYFAKVDLGFDPTAAVHEYRIDYLPDRVVFYADGRVLAEMVGAGVPVSRGTLMLSHWSNGNRMWSGGPPEREAVVAVAYVKAYFNSSDPQRQQSWRDRCRAKKPWDAGAAQDGIVCEIPGPPETPGGTGFFFKDNPDMIVGQIVYQSSASSVRWQRGCLVSGAAMAGVVIVAMLV